MSNNIYIGSNGYVTPQPYNNSGADLTDSTVSFTEMLAGEVERPAIEAASSAPAEATLHTHANAPINATLQRTETAKELLMSLFLGGSGGMSGMITTLLMGQLISNMTQNQSASAAASTHNHSTSYNANASQIVNLAMSRLGNPYSQAMAGQGDYLDCSYLAKWCYSNVGVNLPRTAAEQAQYCVQNGLSVSEAELQPGDLVFFSHHSNGRYMNVTHVAIYAGDGMIVDASSSRGQVVYRPMLSGAVAYGRPGGAQYGSL